MESQTGNQKITKGQALIEYSLILILVVLAVIVVLSLFGPAIGRTYSNAVTGLGTVGSPTHTAAAPTAVPAVAPTPTPAWTFCAIEDNFCSFIGTKHVQYGKNGTYTEMTFSNGTMCTNSVFGDPLVGTVKDCHYLP